MRGPRAGKGRRRDACCWKRTRQPWKRSSACSSRIRSQDQSGHGPQRPGALCGGGSRHLLPQASLRTGALPLAELGALQGLSTIRGLHPQPGNIGAIASHQIGPSMCVCDKTGPALGARDSTLPAILKIPDSRPPHGKIHSTSNNIKRKRHRQGLSGKFPHLAGAIPPMERGIFGQELIIPIVLSQFKSLYRKNVCQQD